MELLTGTAALRAGPIGTNPEMAKVVSTAANLVRDLQALSVTQDQLGRVASNAAKDAQKAVEDPNGTLVKMCNHFKELLCAHVFTYDFRLSPSSEIPRVQTFTPPTYEKDPAKLLEVVSKPLEIPSMPGNLFYTACGDNIEARNPELFAVLEDPTFQAQHEGESLSEQVAFLMPRYAFPDYSAIPSELRQRWSDLMAMTAVDTFTLGGQQVTVKTETDEVLAIAGLRSIADYKAFTALRLLDSYVEKIRLSDAQRLVSLYQQAGANPNNYGVWLSRGAVLVAGKGSITEALSAYLAEKRISTEYQAVWQWLGSTPLVEAPPDLSVITGDSILAAAQALSIAYIAPSTGTGLHTSLWTAFGVGSSNTEQERADAFANKLAQWHDSLNTLGGILGFQAVALVAAITALERVKTAAQQDLAEDILNRVANEGLRLARYVSNAEPLQEAFQALRS